MSLGPLMLDLRGHELEQDEKEMLRHPLVGGVILFSRNYRDPQQLTGLTRQIHNIRQPQLLIAVDHEGGRVQRFRDQFTHLPACRYYGEIYDKNRRGALSITEKAGWLLAMELLSVGIDFSLAPVLDLDTGHSQVVGDRAFHHDSQVVSELARAFVHGMRSAGMAAVGKHFPGHGSVREDSHHATPVDTRRYEDILMKDMVPFERLIAAGLAGIMPAHVIYKQVDDKPAGFSSLWLQEVLRKRLGFKGVIFSDDISMAGAEIAGGYNERALAALNAGCDMVLICNNQEAAVKLLDDLEIENNPVSQVRLMRMHGREIDMAMPDLKNDLDWQATAAEIASIEKIPELDLGDDEIQT